jgi:hypothetical protein
MVVSWFSEYPAGFLAVATPLGYPTKDRWVSETTSGFLKGNLEGVLSFFLNGGVGGLPAFLSGGVPLAAGAEAWEYLQAAPFVQRPAMWRLQSSGFVVKEAIL